MPTIINPVSPPNCVGPRRQAHEARKKRDQYLAALDAGLDPVLVTERTRVAQVALPLRATRHRSVGGLWTRPA